MCALQTMSASPAQAPTCFNCLHFVKPFAKGSHDTVSPCEASIHAKVADFQNAREWLASEEKLGRNELLPKCISFQKVSQIDSSASFHASWLIISESEILFIFLSFFFFCPSERVISTELFFFLPQFCC